MKIDRLDSDVQKNIILIGFMGTGKSTIGHTLAKEIDYAHLDIDDAIVQSTGKSIPQIFADKNEGEKHFRALETRTLQSLKNTSHQIISTGGGVVTVEENRTLLPTLGYVVWLYAETDTILKRTSTNKNRPLLQTKNPRQTIDTLLEQRSHLYAECAHLTLDTEGLHVGEIITGIIESASYHFSAHS